MTSAGDRSQYCSGHSDADAALLPQDTIIALGERVYCDGSCSGGQHPPRVTIQPGMRPDKSMPYPIHIEPDGSVAYQEFWKGDPATLLGFQRKQDVQQLDLLCEDFLADPQQAVGMFAVFARDDASVYVLTLPIESVDPATRPPN